MVSDTAIADTLSGRRGAINLVTRAYRADRNNTILQDISTAVLRASLKLDNEQAIKRTGTIVIRPDLLDPIFEPEDKLLTLRDELRVKGQTVEFGLGLFRMGRPTISTERGPEGRPYQTWNIAFQDATSFLISDKTQGTYTVVKGRNIVAEIRFLLTSLGFNHDLPDPYGWRAPVDFTWPQYTPYLTIINDMLFGINYYALYLDKDGIFRSRERVEPGRADINVVLQSDAYPRMLRGPMSEQRDISRWQNRVSVIVEDPNRAPQFARRQNNDARSPISIGEIGEIADTKVYNGDRVPEAYLQPLPPPSTLPGTYCTAAAWSPDGNHLAVVTYPSSSDGRLHVYDFTSAGLTTVQTTLLSGKGTDVAFHPDGDYIAVTMTGDPYFRVYAFAGGVLGGSVGDPADDPGGKATRCAWRPQGDAIAVAHEPGTHTVGLSVYRWLGNALGARYTDPPEVPASNDTGNDVDWTKDGGRIALAKQTDGEDAAVHVWDWSSGFGSHYPDPVTEFNSPENATKGANTVKWSSDDERLAIGTATNLYIVPFDGGYLTPFTPSEGFLKPQSGTSLDGQEVKTISWRPGDDNTLAVGGPRTYNGVEIKVADDEVSTLGTTGNYGAGRESWGVFTLDDAGALADFVRGTSLFLETAQTIWWHPSGLYLAIAHTAYPYISVVPYQGGKLFAEIADYELAWADAHVDESTIITHPDPRREAYEVYRLNIPGKEDNTQWAVFGWTRDLSPGSPMRHQLGRARALDFEDF